jgi:hypothetical protein
VSGPPAAPSTAGEPIRDALWAVPTTPRPPQTLPSCRVPRRRWSLPGDILLSSEPPAEQALSYALELSQVEPARSAGEVRTADGLDRIRAALSRAFEHFVVHRRALRVHVELIAGPRLVIEPVGAGAGD